jgi:hypothetical protein
MNSSCLSDQAAIVIKQLVKSLPANRLKPFWAHLKTLPTQSFVRLEIDWFLMHEYPKKTYFHGKANTVVLGIVLGASVPAHGDKQFKCSLTLF